MKFKSAIQYLNMVWLNSGIQFKMCPIFRHQIFLSAPLFESQTDVDIGTLCILFKRGQWSPSFVRQQDTRSLFSVRTGATKIRTFQDKSKGPEPFCKIRGGFAASLYKAACSSASSISLWKPSSTVSFGFEKKPKQIQRQLSLQLGISKALHAIGAGHGG